MTAPSWTQEIIAGLRELPVFLRFLVRELLADRCQESAAALTYLSLFAVVPLLTVSFLILSVVPEFGNLQGQLENLIFHHFLPASGAEVQSYLLQFSQQARKLSIPGIIILITSAYLMLKNIEKTFNRIWRAREHRRGLSSFLLYWAVLSLGPVLLGVGALISTYLTSVTLFSQLGIGGDVRSTMLSWMPLLLSALTFTLLFAAVPNCRVPLRHAALGGLLTALMFEAGKKIFAWAMSMSSYEVIYGTFAAIPLFLLWIFLSWLLILAGAEFVRALSSFRTQHARRLSVLPVAIAILERFHGAHERGEVIHEAELLRGKWLFGTTTLGIEDWESLRNQFLAAHILRSTEQGEYLLGRSLSALKLSELYRLLVAPGLGNADAQNMPGNKQPPAWLERVQTLIDAAEQGLRSELDIPVTTLFDIPDDTPQLHSIHQ